MKLKIQKEAIQNALQHIQGIVDKKTTMPIPSLNNDSPAILISRLLGAPTFFKIPNTAIGSVGEISAPNNKQ